MARYIVSVAVLLVCSRSFDFAVGSVATSDGKYWELFKPLLDLAANLPPRVLQAIHKLEKIGPGVENLASAYSAYYAFDTFRVNGNEWLESSTLSQEEREKVFRTLDRALAAIPFMLLNEYGEKLLTQLERLDKINQTIARCNLHTTQNTIEAVMEDINFAMTSVIFRSPPTTKVPETTGCEDKSDRAAKEAKKAAKEEIFRRNVYTGVSASAFTILGGVLLGIVHPPAGLHVPVVYGAPTAFGLWSGYFAKKSHDLAHTDDEMAVKFDEAKDEFTQLTAIEHALHYFALRANEYLKNVHYSVSKVHGAMQSGEWYKKHAEEKTNALQDCVDSVAHPRRYVIDKERKEVEKLEHKLLERLPILL